MTVPIKEDIIRMALEAKLPVNHPDWADAARRFAALVRADERDRATRENAYVLAEREECAKVCDARYMGDNNREDMEAKKCAAAIRARGQA